LLDVVLVWGAGGLPESAFSGPGCAFVRSFFFFFFIILFIYLFILFFLRHLFSGRCILLDDSG